MKERDAVYRAHKLNPDNPELAANFKKLKKEVKSLITAKKKQHIETLFLAAGNSTKKQWEIINKTINTTEKREITKIQMEDGHDTEDNEKMANTMNSHFVNVSISIKNQTQIPNPVCTLNYETNTTMYLRKTTPEEIKEIIESLKTNAAPGYDRIKPNLIKKLKDTLSPILSNLINKTLIEGKFPDCLKMGKVTPIHKKGPTNIPNNYRPITVLTVFAKILEIVLKNRLLEYLYDIRFIHDQQNGFLNKRSTQSAITNIIETIYQEIDNKKTVLAVFLDLCKAFDVVDHQILLTKMAKLGIQEKVLQIFSDYLTNRVQYTLVNDHPSSKLPVTSGVPQGSVLGPILFLIYINDICDCGLRGKVTLFADDTALFYSGTLIDIFQDAQGDLNKICRWTKYNYIKLNHDKCNYIIINNKLPVNNLTLKLYDENIKRVNDTKYLGLILDSKLNFERHINKIRSKISVLCYHLRQHSYKFNLATKYLIYNAHVNSHLNYFAAFWGHARQQDIKKLQITQNKVIKILFNKPFRTSTCSLYSELNILNINEIIKLDSVKLIYKIKTGLIQTEIRLLKNCDIHQHNTRTNEQYALTSFSTTQGRKRLTYQALQWFNELPPMIRNKPTMESFTKNAKRLLLTQRQLTS